MTVQEYITSGDLETFCLGMLSEKEASRLMSMCSFFPQVKKELIAIETFMERLALATAISPAEDLKNKILERLGFEKITLDLDDLPAIDHHNDFREWLSVLNKLIPELPEDPMVFIPLTRKPGLTQTLVYTRLSVPEETHHDLVESFFILKGTCTCTVDGSAYHLSPGDFLEIPVHAEHDIRLSSPEVVAILQHQVL